MSRSAPETVDAASLLPEDDDEDEEDDDGDGEELPLLPPPPLLDDEPAAESNDSDFWFTTLNMIPRPVFVVLTSTYRQGTEERRERGRVNIERQERGREACGGQSGSRGR